MKVGLLAAGLLATAFLLHGLLWRLHPPRRHTRALLLLFASPLVLWWLATFLSPGLPGAELPVWSRLHATLVHAAVGLAYIVAYSAIEHPSPSMTILLAVADAGPAGCDPEDLRARLTQASPAEVRLRAMVHEHVLMDSPEGYRLTTKGRTVAALLAGWRRFIGLPLGG